MRTFIAITLPQEIKDHLSRIQKQLKATGADVKWVTPDNIHLTLKFLGEREDEVLNTISRIIEDIARNTNPFPLRVFSIGAFPTMKSPRIIWAGIDKGDREVTELARQIEEKLAAINIPKEDRPFSSHITIGRTRSSLNRTGLIQELQKAAGSFAERESSVSGVSYLKVGTSGSLEFIVTKITVFKSTLTPRGPIYDILHEVNLKTT